MHSEFILSANNISTGNDNSCNRISISSQTPKFSWCHIALCMCGRV